jgi:tryptophan-rich sensory protein
MKINWILLIGFIIGCNLIGSIGALWTSSDTDWYKSLNKPKFNPPSWVFSPVWTIIFTLMGIALYFIWNSPNSNIRTIALILFAIQFIFNILWNYFFFGINNPFLSLIEIFALLGLILLTGIYFFIVNINSGYLIIPYFIWVSFATFLNYHIWKLN